MTDPSAAGCTFECNVETPSWALPVEVLGKIRQQSVDHAKTGLEACGLILAKGQRLTAFPCPNVHPSPKEGFAISGPHWAAAEDEVGEEGIIAVYHSHPETAPELSDVDKVECEDLGIPYLIYACRWRRFLWHEPEGWVAPYRGRPWTPKVFDCYTLVRDWLLREKGLTIGTYEYEEDWMESPDAPALWEDAFESEGFVEIAPEKIEPGDIILMGWETKIATHAAIYLGENTILHHTPDRLSCKASYGQEYRYATRKVIRYAGKESL